MSKPKWTMLLARKTALAMIGESGSKREALVQAALEEVARHCANIAEAYSCDLPANPQVGLMIAEHIRRDCGVADPAQPATTSEPLDPSPKEAQ